MPRLRSGDNKQELEALLAKAKALEKEMQDRSYRIRLVIDEWSYIDACDEIFLESCKKKLDDFKKFE